MLDFLLVLGQIPGTDIQITFNELAAIAVLVAVWYYRRQLRHFIMSNKNRLLADIRLKLWRRRQLRLPV